jgi:hypothetical protein
LSRDIAIAEKFVRQSPSRTQSLMDMKFMSCVFPMDIPAVGMIPVSCGAFFMVLMICLESPDGYDGEPAYLSLGEPGATWIPFDRSWSELRNSVLYRHCWPWTRQ